MKTTDQDSERLQKILSQAGIASRRAAEDLIQEGRVRVNGQVVRELGAKADPVRDRITVDGRTAIPSRLRYVAYHKPAGVISSMSDEEGRPCLKEVVKRLKTRLFAVGRLDFDSSGLVLLTNDGDLAQRITHPRYEVPKVYRAKVRGRPPAKALERLRKGLRLEDGATAPALVAVESELERKTRLRITIREGRQRQVRRMFDAIGYPVDKLSRVAIGPVRLGTLRPGETRDLRDAEVRALRAAVRGGSTRAKAAASGPESRTVRSKTDGAVRGRPSATGRTPRPPRR